MYMRSPFNELYFVSRDLDDLFRRTFSSAAPAPAEREKPLTSGRADGSTLASSQGLSPTAPRRRFLPAVESFAKDGKLFIRAEMPGVNPAELLVSLTGKTLQISGEKKSAHQLSDADVHLREIEEGRLERSFTLPDGVKSEQLKARFENGVLELSMPLPEETQTRKIEIEAPAGKQIKAA